MWILFQLAALTAVAATQRDCSQGACYPPMGDLLLGRDRQLHASSTCGLTGSEVFCTYFGQWRMKCCPCDSRNPSSQLAHTIQNVLSTAGPNRWWQARKDVSQVTLQLDLQNLFQLDTLILTFKIKFSPLHQFSTISVPNGQKIQEVSGLTGLRVRLTELGTVPRLPGRAPSLFYALREMRVMGTCLCHGHANRCLPDSTTNQLPSTQHNTAGMNCERCADLYNDLPWRPAEEGNTHTCKRCECNNHAQQCRFDPAVYEASGRRSGGVCEGCLHHTTGPKCDRCAPGFQPNHWSSIDRPDACTRCHCSAEGAENGGQCDDVTGSCRCKANVDGPRCDRCKMGYYGLTASNLLGCTKCSCSAEGSLSSVCDPVSGQCPCRPYLQGLTCDLCSHGYWNPSSPRGCVPCRCDPTNSHGDTCDQSTGQCLCRSGFGGRTCTECPDNTYGDPLIGCRPCQCAAGGMVPGGCDKNTGTCRCRLGVTGTRCDACTRGHCDSFPDCEVCPSCFFSLDSYIQNLTLGLERLSPRIPSRPGGSLPTGLGPRIQALEATLTQIRDSLPLPPPSTRQVNDALFQLRRLRDQLDQVDGDLSPQGRGLELGSQLDEFEALLDGLGLLYNTKRDALRNSINSNNAGAFSSIKNAYDEFTDAAKSVEASGKTVDQSLAVREDALDLQNQLCPAEGAPPCGRGESCVGALPLGTRAVRDAEEVKDRLQLLNGKITQAAAQIQKTQDTVNLVRQSTDDLVNQMRRTRDDLEADLQETRYFWILNAKLPLSLAALKRKLQEIRDLAAGLPDSTAVLDQAGPQLDTAQRLLQEAQDASDAALGVKADVDGLLEGFTTVEGSLSGMNDKVQDSLDIVEDISNSLTQTKAQLTPTVKALGEVSALAEGMKPQLEGLKVLVHSGGLLAQNAKGEADKAKKEADAAARKLQEEAGSLAQDTGDMMKSLAGKADSLRRLQDEVLLKSQRLTGLDGKLRDLLADMRQKVKILSTCQG
ncbi:unnamed protein product [Coregonus sp. 'balchen']|nr:unnamed protein product [Coregonus sp. 'balchen']